MGRSDEGAEEEADGVTGRRLGGELARRVPLGIFGLYEPPEATVLTVLYIMLRSGAFSARFYDQKKSAIN